VVPEDQRPAVNALSNLLPNFQINDNFNFTDVTRVFWTSIKSQEWEIFRAINAATQAQKLNIDDYDVSAATGQTAQIMRFDEISEPVITQKFYSTRMLNETEIVRALAVRPTDDMALTPTSNVRFRSSFEASLLKGFDTPACAIESILLPLASRENPSV
jgi:hypothetical protein